MHFHRTAEPQQTSPKGEAGPSGRLPMEYILPLKWKAAFQDAEVTEYLEDLSQWLDITVVDGSSEMVFRSHHQVWKQWVRHVAPAGPVQPNGKVHGVLTGLDLARHELVIIADDDVRYSVQALRQVHCLLQNTDLVRVQNYFDPMPWHAKWDSARSLINRAFASDYPGTLAVRRSALPCGYRGDVLFENLELIRTVLAGGGSQCRADEVLVLRRPPSTAHFRGQRVRQAYDSQAQPLRLALELSILPLVITLRRNPRALGLLLGISILVAEWGRRRVRHAFPPSAIFFAPLWLGERAMTSWIALVRRIAGGVPYSGGKLREAASSLARLRKAADASHQGG